MQINYNSIFKDSQIIKNIGPDKRTNHEWR